MAIDLPRTPKPAGWATRTSPKQVGNELLKLSGSNVTHTASGAHKSCNYALESIARTAELLTCLPAAMGVEPRLGAPRGRRCLDVSGTRKLRVPAW